MIATFALVDPQKEQRLVAATSWGTSAMEFLGGGTQDVGDARAKMLQEWNRNIAPEIRISSDTPRSSAFPLVLARCHCRRHPRSQDVPTGRSSTFSVDIRGQVHGRNSALCAPRSSPAVKWHLASQTAVNRGLLRSSRGQVTSKHFASTPVGTSYVVQAKQKSFQLFFLDVLIGRKRANPIQKTLRRFQLLLNYYHCF